MKHHWVPSFPRFFIGHFCQVGPTLTASLHSVRLKQLPFLCSPIITFPREDPEGVTMSTTAQIIYSDFLSSRGSQTSLAWNQRWQLFWSFSLLLSSILDNKHPTPELEAAGMRLSTQNPSESFGGDRNSRKVRCCHLFGVKSVIDIYVQAVFLHISQWQQVARQVLQRPSGWGKQWLSSFQLNLSAWKSALIVIIRLHYHVETQRQKLRERARKY